MFQLHARTIESVGTHADGCEGIFEVAANYIIVGSCIKNSLKEDVYIHTNPNAFFFWKEEKMFMVVSHETPIFLLQCVFSYICAAIFRCTFRKIGDLRVPILE